MKRFAQTLFALLVVATFLGGVGFVREAGAAKLHPVKRSAKEKGKPVSCPETPRKARKAAAVDYAYFKKIHPNGTWGGFIYKFHTDYADCSKTIRKIYLDAARLLSRPPVEERIRQRDQQPEAPKGALYGIK